MGVFLFSWVMADAHERACFQSHPINARYGFQKELFYTSPLSVPSFPVSSLLFPSNKHPPLQHVAHFWPRHRPQYNPTLQEYCRGFQTRPGTSTSTLLLSVNDCQLSEQKKYLCVFLIGTHFCAFAFHREAKTKVEDLGGALRGFVSAYYEDHIQPATDSYAEWASNIKSSVWEKIQTTIDNYMPINANQSI